MTFRELLVNFEFTLDFTVRHVFIRRFTALRDSQSQAFNSNFVARQVVASVATRAAKLNIFAESRTRVYFEQHVASRP